MNLQAVNTLASFRSLALMPNSQVCSCLCLRTTLAHTSIDFKIQNIVGSCDIKFPIRLEGLASRHHHFSSYEPELFPGLIYRMMKPKIVLLIFVSGKIVLTGAKVREEIYQAFELIYPVLNDFRKI